MLFGFNAVTEHNKTKKRGCAGFKMKTAARSKCCQMKQNCGIRSGAVGLTTDMYQKMRHERVQNLTNAAQRAIIDMFTVGSIHDASNTR